MFRFHGGTCFLYLLTNWERLTFWKYGVLFEFQRQLFSVGSASGAVIFGQMRLLEYWIVMLFARKYSWVFFSPEEQVQRTVFFVFLSIMLHFSGLQRFHDCSPWSRSLQILLCKVMPKGALIVSLLLSLSLIAHHFIGVLLDHPSFTTHPMKQAVSRKMEQSNQFGPLNFAQLLWSSRRWRISEERERVEMRHVRCIELQFGALESGWLHRMLLLQSNLLLRSE